MDEVVHLYKGVKIEPQPRGVQGGWMADFTLVEDVGPETIVTPYYGQSVFPAREQAISVALASAQREINKTH